MPAVSNSPSRSEPFSRDSHLPLRDVVAGHSPSLRKQEGNQYSPTSTHLKVALKTAWHLGHRIREAMRDWFAACSDGR